MTDKREPPCSCDVEALVRAIPTPLLFLINSHNYLKNICLIRNVHRTVQLCFEQFILFKTGAEP